MLKVLGRNPTICLETALTGAQEKAGGEAGVGMEKGVDVGSGLRTSRPRCVMGVNAGLGTVLGVKLCGR